MRDDTLSHLRAVVFTAGTPIEAALQNLHVSPCPKFQHHHLRRFLVSQLPPPLVDWFPMIIRLTIIFTVATAASIFLGSGVSAKNSASEEWKLDLDRANTLLSQGKYNDAIILYDTVIRISFLCFSELIC